jgi:hypothetical protein
MQAKNGGAVKKKAGPSGTAEWERRYRELAAGLAGVGPILQGTITERRIEAGDKTYGPYYQWTFKREGKTVTVNLSEERARWFQQAFENNRNLEATIAEMRELSRQIGEAKTEDVKRRKLR